MIQERIRKFGDLTCVSQRGHHSLIKAEGLVFLMAIWLGAGWLDSPRKSPQDSVGEAG